MSKKRLNHFADAIIGMLTGWQMVVNFNHFKKNGAGKYILDLLTSDLSFNGDKVSEIPIFINIQDWFEKEINEYKVDIASIIMAKVELEVGGIVMETKYLKIRKWIFFKESMQMESGYGKTIINFIFKTHEKDYSKSVESSIWY